MVMPADTQKLSDNYVEGRELVKDNLKVIKNLARDVEILRWRLEGLVDQELTAAEVREHARALWEGFIEVTRRSGLDADALPYQKKADGSQEFERTSSAVDHPGAEKTTNKTYPSNPKARLGYNYIMVTFAAAARDLLRRREEYQEEHWSVEHVEMEMCRWRDVLLEVEGTKRKADDPDYLCALM